MENINSVSVQVGARVGQGQGSVISKDPFGSVAHDPEKVKAEKSKSSGAKGFDSSELSAAMQTIQVKLSSTGTVVDFLYDSQTNKITVLVNNPETGELIRTIPPTDLIRLSTQIENLRGLFVDQEK